MKTSAAFLLCMGFAAAQTGAPTLWAYRDSQCFNAQSPATYNFDIPITNCLNIPNGFQGFEVQLHPNSDGHVAGYSCGIVAYPGRDCQGKGSSPASTNNGAETGCVASKNPSLFTAHSIKFIC